MALTMRGLGKNTQPQTLSGDAAAKFLARAKGGPTIKDPNLDILVALHLYPDSTYDRLLELGFERYGQMWDQYTPGLIEQGLMQQSPEGKYSLTDAGTEYLNSEFETKDLVSRVARYFKRHILRQ